jgi:DNA-binding FadR family transcriptional regulator
MLEPVAAPADEVVFAPTKKPPRAFEEIIAQIKDTIASGRLKSGDKLPTERDLASQFQVGRNTVREALRMLEISGVITLRRGPKGGAFLSIDDPYSLNQQLTDVLRLTDFSVADLTAAMSAITKMLFDAAVASATAEDLDAIEANIREAELTRDPHQRSITLIQFYAVLAAASGNKILALVANLLIEILQKWVVKLGPVSPEFVILSRRAIVKHLRERNSRAAFGDLERFLDQLHDMWLSGVVDESVASSGIGLERPPGAQRPAGSGQSKLRPGPLMSKSKVRGT